MSNYQCVVCRNFNGMDDIKKEVTCKAFPSKIPDELFSGKVSHRSPYPGDHEILFEFVGDENIIKQVNRKIVELWRCRFPPEQKLEGKIWAPYVYPDNLQKHQILFVSYNPSFVDSISKFCETHLEDTIFCDYDPRVALIGEILNLIWLSKK